MKLIRLLPTFKDYIWGGQKLKTVLLKDCPLKRVAESWELSVHRDGQSIVEGANVPLQEFLDANPGFLGENCADGLPILIKFIDAQENLSIQVHPGEDYAMKHENDHGKTEMWYIIDALEGAGIYYGVKEDLTKEEFQKAIESNTITEKLNFVPCRTGDFFLVNAGTIHAIGAGILICEIQQNSNCTYRVYDYDRVDVNGNRRELHIQKAMDVSVLHRVDHSIYGNVGRTRQIMVDCDLFTVEYLPLAQYAEVTTNKASFTSITVLSGKGTMCFGDTAMGYQTGESFLAEAAPGMIQFCGTGEFIITTIKKKASHNQI